MRKQKISYKANREINKKLGIGDKRIIATKANVSYSLVKLTLLGYRNNQKVLSEAQALIEHKQQFFAKKMNH